ncbi:MAG: acylphosphatase [Aeoliella sp.]
MGAVSTVLQRRHVVYSGRVQGVGFRYTTRTIARGYDVTGFVRNLADGGVEVVAEGPNDQLDSFLAELEDRMSGHIRDVHCDKRPAIEEFANFGIRY